MERFKQEFDSKKIYIMKKNIQRQEGLKITNSFDEILDGSTKGYALVQELLQDPYLISGRKTNMRVYVLITCLGDEINVFAHENGFMYYTKDMFKKNSLEDGPNITTGYIDRQVYVDNPLTHADLKVYLDDPKRTLIDPEKTIRNQGLKISEVYFNRIYHLLREVFISFVGRIHKNKKFSNNLMFQLFGIDIAVNDSLQVQIIECNKGPDLGAKDDKDSALKHGVVNDVLKIVGVTKNNDRKNGFIKILDVKDGKIRPGDI